MSTSFAPPPSSDSMQVDSASLSAFHSFRGKSSCLFSRPTLHALVYLPLSPSSSMYQPTYEPDQNIMMAIQSIVDQLRASRNVPLHHLRECIQTLGAYFLTPSHGRASPICAESSIRISHGLEDPDQSAAVARPKRLCPVSRCNGRWARLTWFSKHFREKHSQDYIQTQGENKFFWLCSCNISHPVETEFVDHMWEVHMRN
jgi:hypothetical protein